jgi:hypothetical protein
MLILGLRSGEMKTLRYESATRQKQPIGFWLNATLNLVLVMGGCALLAHFLLANR